MKRDRWKATGRAWCQKSSFLKTFDSNTQYVMPEHKLHLPIDLSSSSGYKIADNFEGSRWSKIDSELAAYYHPRI